ncbi:MAG: hypothetical protein IJV84_08330 [Bacteroidales bacterium]|nr:hypothetical protein [Bacteroidales bacterium]
MKTKLISRICGWVMAAMLAGGMFMSCNLAKVLNDVEDIANGETGVSWSESGNKLSCTSNFVIYTWTVEWTFDSSDKCTSAKSTITWSSAALANQYWDEMEDKTGVTRNGNSFTEDISEEYAGLDKSVIRSSFVFAEE